MKKEYIKPACDCLQLEALAMLATSGVTGKEEGNDLFIDYGGIDEGDLDPD